MNFSDVLIVCYRDAKLVAVVIFRNEKKFTDFIFSEAPSVWLSRNLGLDKNYFSGCYFDMRDFDLKGICQVPVFEIY